MTRPAVPVPGSRGRVCLFAVADRVPRHKRRQPKVSFLVMGPRAESPDFVPIDRRSLELSNVYGRLERLGAYEPVTHVGWVQPANAAAEAIAFRLGQNPDGADAVSGTITLYKERYLHLELDLSLDELDTDPAFYTRDVVAQMRDTGRMIYKLQESRRIRRTNLHYFDHPLFGVIARVEKIEPPDTSG